jgi:hypothetical protein
MTGLIQRCGSIEGAMQRIVMSKRPAHPINDKAYQRLETEKRKLTGASEGNSNRVASRLL